MSSINGYDSVNTLFSSLGSTSSTNSSSTDGLYGINVIDYNTIRNGSYGKLMKAYYAEDDADASKTNSKNDTDDTDQTLAEIKSSTANLKESAQALYSSKSLFEKNADGEYDMEAIYEKVNAFIEDYNAAIDSVGSAETESIAKAGANMVNATTNYVDMLSKIGISVNESDFSLSIDKEKFMESRITDLKSMFSGVGSFAYQIGAKASRINTMVADKVSSTVTFGSSSSTDATSSTSKDTASTIAKIKETANDLVSVGTDLYKNRTLFRQDMDGNYDTEAILDELSAFIEDYNDLLISAENSKSSSITNAVAGVTGIADEFKNELAAIGITIDKEDNTLQLNEDTFLKADMSDAKSLLIGNASFVYKATVKAAMIANQAETESNKSNTYTEDATYSNNYNTGTILNGTV